MMRVALLDSDTQQRKTLESLLQSGGHQYTSFPRSEALFAYLKHEEPELLIIHSQSADPATAVAAVTSARELRPALPVLLITGKPPETRMMHLLADGPTDLLLKPLRRSELLMRMRLLMQRYRPGAMEEDVLAFGPYVFSPQSANLTIDGKTITLTQKEFELALLFFRHLGRPLSRAFIHESVWSHDAELSSRTLDTHVSRVRSKLGLRPERGFRLAPVYSFGYRLEQILE